MSFQILVETEKAKPGSNAALLALGTVVSYMTTAMIDRDIFSFNDIYGLDELSSVANYEENQYVCLFGDTMKNLDVVSSEPTSGTLTLFSTINNTSTKMGMRLLKQWVCNPLARKGAIKDRQLAIKGN